jgi:hypothetical protein
VPSSLQKNYDANEKSLKHWHQSIVLSATAILRRQRPWNEFLPYPGMPRVFMLTAFHFHKSTFEVLEHIQVCHNGRRITTSSLLPHWQTSVSLFISPVFIPLPRNRCFPGTKSGRPMTNIISARMISMKYWHRNQFLLGSELTLTHRISHYIRRTNILILILTSASLSFGSQTSRVNWGDMECLQGVLSGRSGRATSRFGTIPVIRLPMRLPPLASKFSVANLRRWRSRRQVGIPSPA